MRHHRVGGILTNHRGDSHSIEPASLQDFFGRINRSGSLRDSDTRLTVRDNDLRATPKPRAAGHKAQGNEHD
jgi:hypothetical protein